MSDVRWIRIFAKLSNIRNEHFFLCMRKNFLKIYSTSVIIHKLKFHVQIFIIFFEYLRENIFHLITLIIQINTENKILKKHLKKDAGVYVVAHLGD